jgi:hypothetical protein
VDHGYQTHRADRSAWTTDRRRGGSVRCPTDFPS